MFKDELAARIAKARSDLKMTQAKLGEICGVGTGAVSHWETGKNSPSIENLATMAPALKVTIDWLCGIEAPSKELTADEARLLKCFRGCDEEAKRHIMNTAWDEFMESVS